MTATANYNKYSLTNIYETVSLPLAMASLGLMSIKISLCLVSLLALLLLWLILNYNQIPNLLSKKENLHLVPYTFFICLTLCSSFFGVNYLNSLKSLTSILIYSFLPFLFSDLITKHGVTNLLTSFIVGQSAVCFTILLFSSVFGSNPDLFLGEVTHSSQLALIYVVSFGATFLYNSKSLGNQFITPQILKLNSGRIIALITCVVMTSLIFSRTFQFSSFERNALLFVTLSLVAANLWYVFRLWLRNEGRSALAHFLLIPCLPLLTTVFLANLKRGPWIGVIVGCSILLAIYSRKWIMPILLLIIFIFCTITPLKVRLLQSYDHFSIAGGRHAIWTIGSELALRYPLGIGFNNSSILNKFDTEIPSDLKHFHNNFLNITVETGWLGICIFIWWIIACLKQSWSIKDNNPNSILARSIGCAIISWQIAGLVEYNFGNTEVFLVVLFLLGLLSAIHKEDQKLLS
jgi:O-antigen ligase